MLELKNVIKRYEVGERPVVALDGVDLSIEPGTFVAVVGPSGSGKSTLLNMLGALDRPDSGTIAFNGREIAALDEEDQARFRRESIGFVFQFFNLLPAMTAWENVAMPALLAGTSLRKSKGRAVELLDHPFFVATLFQPERAALKGITPPLTIALLKACQEVSV